METLHLHLEVAPRAVLALGEDLVRDDRAALEELVKNAYDADARHVRVVYEVNSGKVQAIRVIDDGTGMSLSDIQEKWLVVATPNKVAAGKSTGGRVLTGQKGIGRLATARLGSGLELGTVASGNEPLKLSLDWSELRTAHKLSDFSVQADVDPEAVAKLGVSERGTALRITGLHRTWTITPEGGDDFDELEEALSRVLNPFSEQTGMSLTLEAEGDFTYIRTLSPPELLEHPHYRLVGEVMPDGSFTATYSRPSSSRTVSSSDSKYSRVPADVSGGFRFDLRAWDREAGILKTEAEQAHLDLAVDAIRDILNRLNGVFVYRDDFLAYPKREDDRDWLGLERRRVNNPSQRLGLSQVVAAAFISRDRNSELKDKSDREGLVDNLAFRQFRSALDSLLNVLETERLLDKPAMGKAKAQPQTEVQIDRLATAAKQLRSGTMSSTAAATLIEGEAARLEAARKAINARMSVLGRLAAVGQLAGLLVHEISHSLPTLTESLRKATEAASRGKDAGEYVGRAGEALRAIQRVVQRFSPFFVGGIRTRRKASDLAQVVAAALETRTKAISDSGVVIDASVPQGIRLKMDPGDVLAITTNLLDNALYWAGTSQGDKRIRITGKKDGEVAQMTFSDSGPGFDDSLVDRVFEPGFTTRKGGMGLGLAVVRDIATAHGGKVEAEGTSRLGGARFKVVIPTEN